MQTSARQNVRAAIERVTYTDLDGTAKNLFTKLPNGVIPLALTAVILTAFNTGTTHVLDIGNGTTGNAYFNDINLKSAAGTRTSASALPSLINDVSGGLQLLATDTPVGTAATAGEVMLILTYVEDGVEQFSQG